jgi:hypothetical protein
MNTNYSLIVDEKTFSDLHFLMLKYLQINGIKPQGLTVETSENYYKHRRVKNSFSSRFDLIISHYDKVCYPIAKYLIKVGLKHNFKSLSYQEVLDFYGRICNFDFPDETICYQPFNSKTQKVEDYTWAFYHIPTGIQVIVRFADLRYYIVTGYILCFNSINWRKIHLGLCPFTKFRCYQFEEKLRFEYPKVCYDKTLEIPLLESPQDRLLRLMTGLFNRSQRLIYSFSNYHDVLRYLSIVKSRIYTLNREFKNPNTNPDFAFEIRQSIQTLTKIVNKKYGDDLGCVVDKSSSGFNLVYDHLMNHPELMSQVSFGHFELINVKSGRLQTFLVLRYKQMSLIALACLTNVDYSLFREVIDLDSLYLDNRVVTMTTCSQLNAEDYEQMDLVHEGPNSIRIFDKVWDLPLFESYMHFSFSQYLQYFTPIL